MTILAVLLLGCDQGGYSYAGHDMVDHFPLDGERKWIYSNAGYNWRLNVEKSEDVEVVDTTEIHTFEYWQADSTGASAEHLMNVRWSSDTYDGVLQWAYRTEARSLGDNPGMPPGGGPGPEELARLEEWLQCSVFPELEAAQAEGR